MTTGSAQQITEVIGQIPYRMALAGGWIDQPFVSRHNPVPPGSMVVVALQPQFRFMDRSGMASGTRRIAMRLWNNRLPEGEPGRLVRELYAAENYGQAEPSGSQDMIGLVYPGINRLDYDCAVEGGYFPRHIETCLDPLVVGWLEHVVHILPVAPRPSGYNPLGEKHLDPAWVRRLGLTGQTCYDAILARDTAALGSAMNECMICWEHILPHTVRHPSITLDLLGLLSHYQARYPGAMYSGCGGGYLLIVSEESVPGAFQAKIRT